jgi:Cof subfamily protein (haloacid dehalogenase superfamily)
VDGTILERGRPLSARVVWAVHQAVERGIHVTLASGRMYPLVEALAAELDLRTPIICYGGALIVEPNTRRILHRRSVPLALAREVIREARAQGLDARAYVGEQVFVDRLDPNRFNYDSLLRVNAIAVGDLLAHLTDDPTHLAIDSPPERTRQLVEEMRLRFGDRLHVTTGHPLLVEFSRPDVHKGTGLAWLAAFLGVSLSETMAIGDDWNDVEMLRWAGLGVAVANAQPAILAEADAIVPPVGDDGVAVAIERFVLGSN